MDNYGGAGAVGGNGFPIRNSSRSFNDSSGGTGGNSMMSGAERVAQPLAHYANSNGIPSRPGGGAREDGVAGSGGGRSQQPSHDVFMVREAGRVSSGGGIDGRSSFATSGNRLEQGGDSSVGGEQQLPRQVVPAQSQQNSHSNSHHRERTERDRDREREHQQQRQLLPLPKMLKIAVVGESTSGKTAICNAFTSEGYNFSRNYHMTTGVSIYAKSIKLPSGRLGGGEDGGEQLPTGNSFSSSGSEDPTNLLEPRINLVLVDSAGKPIYRELLPHYVLAKGSVQRQKHISTSSNDSRDQSGNGGGDTGNKRNGDQPFLGVLIGSKRDLKDQRVISPKAAQDFASQHGLQYFECSAKENSGIEEPFFYLAHQWTNSGGPADKENAADADVTASSGGIFAMNRAVNGSNGNSNSKRSAFSSRQQGSSSEAF